MNGKPLKYLTSHPYISFAADLQRVDYHIWILLGEARSKCDHLSMVPLKPDVATNLHQVYLAKGAHATAAIEGNTLSEKEVELRMANNLDLPPSKEYLGVEIDNVLDAIQGVFTRQMDQDACILTVEEILEINRIVLNDLTVEEGVVPGIIRTHNVGVNRYAAPDWQDCGYLLQRMCDWLNDPVFRPDSEMRIPMGIIRAILAHLYIAWIHPFGDGNGRTARAIEFKILLGSGVPSPACQLLSNHYNATRAEYYRQLDRASASNGELGPFVKYAVQGFVDQLKEQLKVVWQQQYQIAWMDYVYEALSGDGKTEVRQRHLVTALTREEAPVPTVKLMELDAKVARDYAHLTSQALTRDLRRLTQLKLIKRTKDGWRTAQDTMLAFHQPARHIIQSDPGVPRSA